MMFVCRLKHLNLERNEISAVPQLEPKTVGHDRPEEEEEQDKKEEEKDEEAEFNELSKDSHALPMNLQIFKYILTPQKWWKCIEKKTV